MKIALVGPGIMPIPPPGWGAVEILLMDYYMVLSKTHEVDLINILRSTPADSLPCTEYTTALIRTINETPYDFVHIHYDVLYHIVPHLVCKNVGITSHFPFIDRSHLHGEYATIFRGICESRAYIFALAEKDKAAFLQHGVSNDRLFLMINGANAGSIVPARDGIYDDRSAYVAKVEARKRQTLVATMDSVDFYGRAEGEFKTHPRYKGEVEHTALMTLLPQYGNLVLLSEGESDPLVVKEALMAGLPVVITPCCTNDLDCSRPFIDVIPEERVNDAVYVHTVIATNRAKKAQYTEEIRRYAVDHFSWETLVADYSRTLARIVRKRSFAIVGPGMMPIPPAGWGACEILVWNYACELRRQGHTVDIINTPHMSEMIARIQQLKPDVVHIQYDNYGCIIPDIVGYCHVVAVTGHFAYLDQPETWNSYRDVWNGMTHHPHSNVYQFVLSESIAKVYRELGVNPGKIMLAPNGADPQLFAFAEHPLHADRSIVVAKVERRKGQYLLQDNSEVWFAGNRGDDTFDYSNPRWLGEWSKTCVYQSLTHYGNLVLLSEGEADPLVVKEALVAGLGVVVSPWATANLDLSQPFITVIPADRMRDRVFVDHAIRANRTISLRMRAQIREYSRQFYWSTLVHHYVEVLETLLPATTS